MAEDDEKISFFTLFFQSERSKNDNHETRYHKIWPCVQQEVVVVTLLHFDQIVMVV